MKMLRRIITSGVVLCILVAALWIWRGISSQTPVSPYETPSQDDVAAGIDKDAPQRLEEPHRTAPGAEVFTIPARYAFASHTQVPQVDDWEALLAELSPEDREFVERFAARYPEAYLFTSAEQLRWMVERGFPMPEEILAARDLSLDTLLEMEAAGNLKAGMLALDRWMEELELHPLSSMEPEDAITEGAGLIQLEQRMRGTCSPFAYYIAARANRFIFNYDPGEMALAHLAVAVSLGDSRLTRTMNQMAQELSIPPESLRMMGYFSSSSSTLLSDDCSRHRRPIPGVYQSYP